MLLKDIKLILAVILVVLIGIFVLLAFKDTSHSTTIEVHCDQRTCEFLEE